MASRHLISDNYARNNEKTIPMSSSFRMQIAEKTVIIIIIMVITIVLVEEFKKYLTKSNIST